MEMNKQILGLKGKSFEKTLYLKSIKLRQSHRDIIVGTLLGDATLDPRKTTNKIGHRYRFCQKSAQKVYVEHIYNQFSEWSLAGVTRGKSGRNIKGEQLYFYYFQTCVHPAFDFYANQFYSYDKISGKRNKIVPKLIHKWLNPVVLSYWFMDDGCKEKVGYVLNTQGFTLQEQEMIANAIGRKFGFEVNIHKDRHNYRLYICTSSKDKFTGLVKPYVIPSFVYKLHL